MAARITTKLKTFLVLDIPCGAVSKHDWRELNDFVPVKPSSVVYVEPDDGDPALRFYLDGAGTEAFRSRFADFIERWDNFRLVLPRGEE